MASACPKLQSVFAPSPQTKRGYGVQIHSSKAKGLFTYCNGKNVIIRQINDPLRCEIFSEHKCNVSVAKFSPNGEWVASGDCKGRVLVWGLKNKIVKSEVNVCRDVFDIAWSDDGKRIVAVGDGSDSFAKAFLWDTGSTVGDITNHSKSILSVDIRQVRPYRVVTASEDKQVNIYQGPPFRFDKMHDKHSRYPNQVRFSPNGEFFISVGSDKSIFLFAGESGDFIRDLSEAGAAPDAHQGSIWSFCWSPDSSSILTVSGDSTAKVWNVKESKVVQTFSFPAEGTTCHQQVGCLWHDEDTLLTVSLSGSINFLDRKNPSTLKSVIRGHCPAISALCVDMKSKLVYSGDCNGSIYQWNPLTNVIKEMNNVGEGAKNISDMAVSSDTSTLSSVAFDDILRYNAGATGVALPGQPVAMAAGSNGVVIIVTRKKQLVVVVNNDQVDCVDLGFVPSGIALSPDGLQVAVSGDKSVPLFNIDGKSHKATAAQKLIKHTDATSAVAYSPDGRFLCTADGQRSVYVWNRDTGEVCNPSAWRFHAAKVTSVCFSPSSKALATGSVDQSVLVFTDFVEFTSTRMKIDPAHMGGVSQVKFLDDTRLVSTGDDRAVKLWELSA